MKKIFSLMMILVSLLVLYSLSFSQEEKLTITTYYPSPYGVYKTLRIYPNDDFTPYANCNNRGEMYYDDSEETLYVCSGDTQTQWIPLPGERGYWRLNRAITPNQLYATNTNWNVGIGTDSPDTKLDVASTISIVGPAGLSRGMVEGGQLNLANPTQSDGGQTNAWSIDNYQNNLRFFYNSTSPRLFINSTTGNLGIGTTNPGGKLHVSHDGISPNLVVNSTTGNVGIGTTNPGGNKLRVSHNGVSPSLVVSSTTGNVGIGTMTPNSSKGNVGYLDAKDVYLRDVNKWASNATNIVTVNGDTGSTSDPGGCADKWQSVIDDRFIGRSNVVVLLRGWDLYYGWDINHEASRATVIYYVPSINGNTVKWYIYICWHDKNADDAYSWNTYYTIMAW